MTFLDKKDISEVTEDDIKALNELIADYKRIRKEVTTKHGRQHG